MLKLTYSYSQGIRYRRIISDNDVFEQRLIDLSHYFIDCNYPPKMVNEILRDVQKLERNIDYNTKTNDTAIDVPWVTTYGPGSVNVKKYSKIL